MPIVLSEKDCYQLARKPVFFLRIKKAGHAAVVPGKYGLGQGGFDPGAEDPYSDGGLCDCSGFYAWVIGLSRRPKPSRPFWIESTAVYQDAMGPQKAFIQLSVPIPGCGIVYPDRKVLGVHREGHMAIVVSAVPDRPEFRTIDCRPSNVRRTGRAIAVGSGNWMLNRRAIFVTLKQDLTQL